MTTTQEALQAAIDLLNKEGLVEEDEIQVVKQLCTAALLEVKKRTPSFWVASDGGSMIASFDNKPEFETFCELVTPLHQFELFTSPLAAEWVGLSDADCNDIREEARDMLVDNDTLRIAEATLKRLNSK